VADILSMCVKLLVAAGKWQNSGRTPAAVVFSVMADAIPLQGSTRALPNADDERTDRTTDKLLNQQPALR
jgi:hypothetical protein